MKAMHFLLAALLLFSPAVFAEEVDLMKLGRPVGDDTPMMDRFVYFNETTVSKNVTLDKSVLPPEEAKDWLAQRVAEVMTLDGQSYIPKVTANKKYFTDEGYRQYAAALEGAQVRKLLIEQHYKMSAVVLQTPRLTASGLREVEGQPPVYVWQMDVPVTLTYQNIDGSTNYTVYLSAEISRIPMREDGALVALNAWKFTPKPR
jgi:hypothetical protein